MQNAITNINQEEKVEKFTIEMSQRLLDNSFMLLISNIRNTRSIKPEDVSTLQHMWDNISSRQKKQILTTRELESVCIDMCKCGIQIGIIDFEIPRYIMKKMGFVMNGVNIEYNINTIVRLEKRIARRKERKHLLAHDQKIENKKACSETEREFLDLIAKKERELNKMEKRQSLKKER